VVAGGRPSRGAGAPVGWAGILPPGTRCGGWGNQIWAPRMRLRG